MKLGIIGTGNVGCAITLAAVARGSAREIVLVNRTRKTAEAVATDIRYGTPLTPKVDINEVVIERVGYSVWTITWRRVAGQVCGHAVRGIPGNHSVAESEVVETPGCRPGAQDLPHGRNEIGADAYPVLT
jgi:predicted dinucleotide-binding enzyme